MLDNLRSQSSFEEAEEQPDPNAPAPPKPRKKQRSLDQVTGMTAGQRLALAVMLLVVVCLLGTMLLFISGKVALPSFLS